LSELTGGGVYRTVTHFSPNDCRITFRTTLILGCSGRIDVSQIERLLFESIGASRNIFSFVTDQIKEIHTKEQIPHVVAQSIRVFLTTSPNHGKRNCVWDSLFNIRGNSEQESTANKDAAVSNILRFPNDPGANHQSLYPTGSIWRTRGSEREQLVMARRMPPRFCCSSNGGTQLDISQILVTWQESLNSFSHPTIQG
jgi:hypothetical protein